MNTHPTKDLSIEGQANPEGPSIEEILVRWHEKVTGMEGVKFTPDMDVQDLIKQLAARESRLLAFAKLEVHLEFQAWLWDKEAGVGTVDDWSRAEIAKLKKVTQK